MTTATAEKPAADLITFDDFCARVADGEKADLIDGVIYMASPDSRRANQITRLLTGLLDMYISARRLGGEIYVNRFAFKLSEYNAPEPDVGYVSEARLSLVQEGRMDGGPDVAVEVVSPDSRERDYIRKRRLYEQFRVGEYWIIDPIQKKTEFLRLADDGRYELVPLEQGRIFRSRLVPGFWLNVDWVLTQPLPGAYECLQQLLAAR